MAELDPVEIEIYRHLFTSIAEEMGTVLRRSSYSSNIKERRDYSCAVFDGRGRVIAMGDHMPVHLGSMPLSVQAAMDRLDFEPGDIVFLNDPFAGGTHLPDVTLISPVFAGPDDREPSFFTAARAHHSDVGGMSPGSMPLSTDVFQEGVRIPPLKLYEAARLNKGVLQFFLNNVRTPVEREGDLAAQVGAIRIGQKRLIELVSKNGPAEVASAIRELHSYAERTMRTVIAAIPDGKYQAEEYLDDDGVDSSAGGRSVKIRVALEVRGERMKIDFGGSDPQVAGCLNAVYAITVSAVYYVLKCLAPEEAPASSGLMSAVEIAAPRGSVVNAAFPAATAGGNVETSQRIVDALLRAFSDALPDRIPAASSGTMNNLSIGGIHPASGIPFTYYETIGGGMGAGPRGHGDSGIHTHMTNSLNTPIEALEQSFPIRVLEYRLRNQSGGKGKHRGGDGIVRSLEVLTDCQATILSERRKHAPYGLAGGGEGKKGFNFLLPAGGRRKRLRGKESVILTKGDALIIETPGGGGWGKDR